MNEDNSKPPSTSWLSRLSQFINSEPKDREELLDVFQTAADNTVINTDSLGTAREFDAVPPWHPERIQLLSKSRLVLSLIGFP